MFYTQLNTFKRFELKKADLQLNIWGSYREYHFSLSTTLTIVGKL